MSGAPVRERPECNALIVLGDTNHCPLGSRTRLPDPAIAGSDEG